jgi:hypothetical protein
MATVEQTMMKVQRIMTGPMGLKVMVDGDGFRVSFHEASSFLRLRILPWTPREDADPGTVILVTAPILREVTPTPELYEWVAKKGGSRWFGHVEVHEIHETDQVNLLFSHTLLGDFIDQPELEAAMWGVLSAADTWDDELQTTFGGKRSIDD